MDKSDRHHLFVATFQISKRYYLVSVSLCKRLYCLKASRGRRFTAQCAYEKAFTDSEYARKGANFYLGTLP